MAIVTPCVDRYIHDRLPERDSLLTEMEDRARENDFPIIGPQVGRLLAILAGSLKARRVFELGSGFGYSALWMCRAMGPEGRIICTEGSQENAELARDSFRRAGLEDQLTFHVGDACEILTGTEGLFDIILNDIDKWEYPRAFDLALPRLRTGGLLITDNVLWGGAVLKGDPDRDTQGILDYTRKAMTDPRVFSTILPIRDGLGLSWKIG